jgi:hypothetical protein
MIALDSNRAKMNKTTSWLMKDPSFSPLFSTSIDTAFSGYPMPFSQLENRLSINICMALKLMFAWPTVTKAASSKNATRTTSRSSCKRESIRMIPTRDGFLASWIKVVIYTRKLHRCSINASLSNRLFRKHLIYVEEKTKRWYYIIWNTDKNTQISYRLEKAYTNSIFWCILMICIVAYDVISSKNRHSHWKILKHSLCIASSIAENSAPKKMTKCSI